MRKHGRRQMLRQMEEVLQMPSGTLYRALRMEFTANRQAVVDGCLRILQYEENRICLQTVEGVVSFEGDALCVNCLAGGSAVVSGRICTVGFSE